MKLRATFSVTVFALLGAASVLAHTPPPKIPRSDEPPGKEAQKDGSPGASWSAAAKHDKQKAADKKTDGGPVVIPPTPAKAE